MHKYKNQTGNSYILDRSDNSMSILFSSFHVIACHVKIGFAFGFRQNENYKKKSQEIESTKNEIGSMNTQWRVE